MGSNISTHFSSLRLAPCCKGMAKQVKSGYMLRFKKRLFGKDWREEYVVLYSDSTIAWFRERDRLEPDGGIVIREAPHLIAIAQWTSRIPNRPELPPGRTHATLLAFGSRNKDKVHWFLCRDETDLSDWMTAISNTLPPPPFPPSASPMSGQEQDQSINNTQYKVAPPPPLPQGYLPPPPPYSDNRRYDNNPIGPRTVAVQPSMQPMAPNNTTVLIRDGGRGGSQMDGFATGLLLGNMLNTGPSFGWGLGWGWGGHYGHSWGGGVGFYNNDSDVYINNSTQINNYSQYDNHTIDNDYNINNTDVTAAGDCHDSVVGGLGIDVIGNDCNDDYDDDYDMLGGYDGGLGGGDAFDAGCDFAF